MKVAGADGGASIVSLTFDGRYAWPIYDWMGVAKAGLEATARYLARDLGEYNIRVNTVSAGPIRTMAGKSIPGFDAISGPNPAAALVTPESHWPEEAESRAAILGKCQGEFGDCRQELVFIGQNIDFEQLRSELDSCLLSDEEWALGVESWLSLADPFGLWHMQVA